MSDNTVTVDAEEFSIPESEKDLPMFSNVNDVHVLHYVFNMRFNFQKKIMSGSTIIFVTITRARSSEEAGAAPTKTAGCDCPDEIVLDSCALKVSRVSYIRKLEVSAEQLAQREHWLHAESESFQQQSEFKNKNDWFYTEASRQLAFQVSKWSLTIRNWCPCSSVKTETSEHTIMSSSSDCQEQENKSSPASIHVLRIDYETLPGTPSLHWRPAVGFQYHSSDPNHTYVVYTPGALVNNRGVFPCQDAPAAFATWEALVHVQRPYQALLTSEQIGQRHSDEKGEYYYRSTQSMPISTFAIIVGVFEEHDIYCNREFETRHETSSTAAGLIPARFMMPTQSSLAESSMNWDKICHYTRLALQAAYNTFGPHPFPRLDFVIMPSCFQTLSMASPYLIFLSPANFTGHRAHSRLLYYIKIPHEISHMWFGLAIGAKDWNEEWLSEGFATFAEDVLFSQVMLSHGPPDSPTNVQIRTQIESEIELKVCMMLHILQNELASLEPQQEPELQILAPTPAPMDSTVPAPVPNGLVPLRQFLQLHYLKGYFFLRHLCNLVGGLSTFLPFLKSYVQRYSGQLVTSEEFVQFFFESFSTTLHEKNIVNYDVLYKEWLFQPELPEPLRSLNILNYISNPVKLKYEEITVLDLQKCKTSFRRIYKVYKNIIDPPVHDSTTERKPTLESSTPTPTSKKETPLNAYELILLFELILNSWDDSMPDLPERISNRIGFQPEHHNPEVLHRWCEILLKAVTQSHSHSLPSSSSSHGSHWRNTTRLKFIEKFLLQNPALGLYLYGELMITELAPAQELARSLYRTQLQVLDSEAKSLLRNMIF